MKKTLSSLFLILLSPFVSADLFEAWDFKAIDGDVQNNVAMMESAREIHEKMGAHVEYWLHDVNGENVVSYVIRFKDMDDWAKFKDAQLASEAWSNWVAKQWPKSQPYLVTSYAMSNLFNPTQGTDVTDGLNVSYMSAWQASDNSNNMALYASIEKSTAISEKYGITTQVYLNGPSGIFYIFSFGENFQDISKKTQARNNSAEWQQYWTDAQINRVGEFVRQGWITKIR